MSGSEKITKATKLPDDGVESLARFVEADTLKEIDQQFLGFFKPDELEESNLPKLWDAIKVRHTRQSRELLNVLLAPSIHYCWRWSRSLEETHTPRWLIAVLAGKKFAKLYGSGASPDWSSLSKKRQSQIELITRCCKSLTAQDGSTLQVWRMCERDIKLSTKRSKRGSWDQA